jgi:hypothetical protein
MSTLATVRRQTWQARRVSPVHVKLPRIWWVGHSIGRAESANENTLTMHRPGAGIGALI